MGEFNLKMTTVPAAHYGRTFVRNGLFFHSQKKRTEYKIK